MTNIFIKNPFVLFCIFALSGIMAAKYVLPMSQAIILTLSLLSLAAFFRIKKRTVVSNFLLLFTIFGSMAIRYNISTNVMPLYHLGNYDIRFINCFEGIIEDCYIKKDGRNRYLLSLEKIVSLKEVSPVTGKVLLRTKNISTVFKYGDRIRLFGNLSLPDKKRFPGQYDYGQYLAEQNIYHLFTINPSDTFTIIARREGTFLVQYFIEPLRVYFRKTFDTYLSDKTSSLLKALILGEKQDLGSEMVTLFQEVGVVHVLAISGLHVGFIIAFVFGFASLFRINQGKKLALLILILIIYIILVRFKTPVIRASSMAILFFVAKSIERRASVYNIIFAAMFLILMIDPRELFKPGFQFSFLAVLSIIYGYERLNDILPLNNILKDPHSSWINKLISKGIWIPLLVSAAAVLGTLPLTLFYYGSIPMYAIFANLIIIPMTGLIVLLSLFLLLTAVFSTHLSLGIGKMIMFLDAILQNVTELFANFPFASIISIKPTPYQLLLLYMWIYLFFNIKVYGAVKVLALSIFPPALLALSLWIKAGGVLKVTFLDVGQGDATFLEFPNGKNMLIDAGSASQYWNYGEKTVLPFLQSEGITRITYLVGSHAHNDHIGGFPHLIERITVDTLVLSSYNYHSNLFKEIERIRIKNDIFLKTVYRGDQLFADPTCRVYILHPDSGYCRAANYGGMECNNSSVVMKIQYGENSILFTGDLEREGEIPAMLYNSFLESEIIKVGHHGSITSTSESFLKNVNPIAAIISVAKKNKFNHPSVYTIERLKKWDVRTFLTSQEGSVQFLIRPDSMIRRSWR